MISQGSAILAMRTKRLAAILVLLLISLNPVFSSVKLYLSRANAYALLGGKEERLYFSECEQTSNPGSCVYAMDSSISQEPSQCAQTVYQKDSFWLGILEKPAYITKVTVMNADRGFATQADALMNLRVMANSHDCFRSETKFPFDKRTFPCDMLGEVITIRSNVVEPAVLSICDVEVIGVPLKFVTLAGSDMLLPKSHTCFSSNMASGSCGELEDNVTTTCVTTKPLDNYFSYFVLMLPVASIINEVHVYATTDEPFEVEVHGQFCVRSKEVTAGLVKFLCKYFGDVVMVSLRTPAQNSDLTVCEVKVFGHESDARELQKYAYLGCYIEQPHDRDLPQMVSATKLTAEKCYKVCKRFGFKYFGLQNQRLCYCGNSYGKHGKAMDNFGCEKPCDGDGSLMCGNDRANSLFEIIS